MEKKFYTDNFERLLKEKSDDFRMYPSKRVWHSIYNDLHPGRKWPSVAMSMILVIALLLIGSLNTNDNAVKTSIANTSGSKSTVIKNTNTLKQPANKNDSKGIPESDNTVNGTSFSVRDANTSMDQENDINSSASGKLSGNEGTVLANNYDPANYLKEKNALQPATGSDNPVKSMEYYIRSNQLFADINLLNTQKESRNSNTTVSNATGIVNKAQSETTTSEAVVLQNYKQAPPAMVANVQNGNKTVVSDESTALNSNRAIPANTVDPNDQKAWMEDYALHNRSQQHQRWKDRLATELYVTPSVGFRNLSSNINNEAAAQSFASGNSAGRSVNQKPSLNLEAGFGIAYSVAKNLRLKTGVQINYTSYGINADEINHPIGTTLLLNDPNSGLPYLTARTSTLSNSSGLQSATVHNSTYQVSVPIGFAIKLAGNKKIEWYAGGSVQPSFVFGGLTHFISSDYSSYVSDASLLRKWNMNTGVETYLNYKMKGFDLQVGPQFRYQLFSTYNKQYTVNENLYNVGIKVGLVKNF